MENIKKAETLNELLIQTQAVYGCIIAATELCRKIAEKHQNKVK